MTSRSIVSPEEQSATFIELFFDLVFVFSVTQVVSLLHHGLTLELVGQAILIFWLVWWAWTQFTWSLNAADTTHHWVELGTLAATAVAFMMAVALPDAFHGRGLWFAVPYVLVRGIGLGLYAWVANEHPKLRQSVRRFTLASLSGLAAVLLGGLLGGTLQYWFWGAAILLDIGAATIGGREEGWGLHPEHFGERHGLFVIIALGETLIVAAAGLTGATWSLTLVWIAVLAVAVSCGLWWSYFTHLKPLLDHALEHAYDVAQTMMARDVYSLLHFPMLLGVIGYAVAVDEAIAHPSDPFPLEARLALALGLLLFIGIPVVAAWRASRRVLTARGIVAVAAAGLIVLLEGISPVVALGIALVAVVAIALVEEQTMEPADSASAAL